MTNMFNRFASKGVATSSVPGKPGGIGARVVVDNRKLLGPGLHKALHEINKTVSVTILKKLIGKFFTRHFFWS